MPDFVPTAWMLIYKNPGQTADEIAQLALDLGCPSDATEVSPLTSFSTTIHQYVREGWWPDITREKDTYGVYLYYPRSTIAPPRKGSTTLPRSSVLTHNPYNPDYVINGCPVHSSDVRWVKEDVFYPEAEYFVCEECGQAYSQEEVKAVLERDQLKLDLDILASPIKYAWAGEYPHNGGDGLECPMCGSPETFLGTISETSKRSSRLVIRWKCHRCAAIFDMMDVPEYWGYVKQAAVDAAWAEEDRLGALYGDQSDPDEPEGFRCYVRSRSCQASSPDTLQRYIQ